MLLDDIRAQHTLHTPRVVDPSKLHAWMTYANGLWQFLKDPDLIVTINGVATFYYETCRREYWDLGKREHFPDLTPPRQTQWLEYRMPRRIYSDIRNVDNPAPNGRAGVLLFRVKPEDVQGEGIPAHAAWILSADIFLDYGLKPIDIEGPHGAWTMAIDVDGRIIGVPYVLCFTGDDRERQDAMQLMVNWLHPPLLALSWLPRELPEDRKVLEI